MIFNITIFSSYNISNNISIEITGFILVLIFAIAIDLLFGEFPAKIHPVVIIGNFISYFKKYFIKIKNKLSGVYLTIAVTISSIIICILILLISTINFFVFIVVSALLLSSMFSFKLLLSSANTIKNDLSININKARNSISFLVSRKTDELSEKLIISAVIETLTENITDSCVSVFFYYLVAGILIAVFSLLFNNFFNFNDVFMFINKNLFYIISIFSILITVLYRVVNTLDAMVGYKNHEYLLIGWFPAKLDDLLNYIPSRLSGIIIVISAFLLKLNWKNSYFILKRDSKNCPSPNSGFTMAAAAGTLDIQLIKQNHYEIGDENQKLTVKHIDKAIKLSKTSIFLSIIFLIGIFYLILYFTLIFYNT
jgi:adenosylcobinamide-phosphate synthase